MTQRQRGGQSSLAQQRQQGRSVQFHAGDIHYASAELLSSSERDLRHQRRSLFQTACRRQGIDSTASEGINSGENPINRAGRHDRGSIRRL